MSKDVHTFKDLEPGTSAFLIKFKMLHLLQNKLVKLEICFRSCVFVNKIIK